FRVSLSELREVADELGLDAWWTLTAEAAQYRETLALEQAMKTDTELRRKWLEEQATFSFDDESLGEVGQELEEVEAQAHPPPVGAAPSSQRVRTGSPSDPQRDDRDRDPGDRRTVHDFAILERRHRGVRDVPRRLPEGEAPALRQANAPAGPTTTGL